MAPPIFSEDVKHDNKCPAISVICIEGHSRNERAPLQWLGGICRVFLRSHVTCVLTASPAVDSRYADVVVHRLLAASLNLAPLPAKSRDRTSLHSLADNLNTRHRNAQFAGRASVELHTLIFFRNRTVVADARIIRVRHTDLC